MKLDPTVLYEALYALGIGILIGLERSTVWAAPEPQGEPKTPAAETITPPEDSSKEPQSAFFAEMGVRTFSLLALGGFVASVASDRWSIALPVLIVVFGALIVSRYWRATHEGTGITTEVAAAATVGLGVLCHGFQELATLLALLMTVVLASKHITRHIVTRMRRVELTDTLKLLVIVLILLPLLPNHTLDRWEIFNPYKVGLLVVLISGISFVGYFLTRILGARRGLGLMGILGGMTSSTAVTASMASEVKKRPDLLLICAFSTLAANATMFIRVLVVVSLISTALLARLAWSLGAMAAVTIAIACFFWLRASRFEQSGGPTSIKLENPFALRPALGFAAFFVFILFIARFMKLWFGQSGLMVTAALAGFADVDAITMSVSEQVHGAVLDPGPGALAITVAVVMNSIVKTSMALFSGGRRFGLAIGASLGAATVVGLIVAFLMS